MPRHAPPLTDPDEIAMWDKIIANQGMMFTTSGRGSRPGISFTYTISMDEAGAEMFVSTRSKSITRSTILYAYKRVKEMGGCIPGPKSIGVHGDSYIYAVFKGIGVIKIPLVEE